MIKNNTRIKKKIFIFVIAALLATMYLIGRLTYIMVFRSEYYTKLADELHERERSIKAQRGEILDRNGQILASNKTVCTISVVYNQVSDPERVIQVLSTEFGLSTEEVEKR